MKRSEVVQVLLDDSEFPFVIGEKVFIRTVTFHYTGRISAIKRAGECYFLVLEDAAWIALSARFSSCIETGALEEVEPVTSPVRVNTSAIVDVFCWNHPLPRTVK